MHKSIPNIYIFRTSDIDSGVWGFPHTDLLPAMDGDAKTLTFLQEVVDILLAYIVESFDRETKVIDFHYPNELLQLNNWELQDAPANLDDILISCRATLKYAIKTGRHEPSAGGGRRASIHRNSINSHFQKCIIFCSL